MTRACLVLTLMAALGMAPCAIAQRGARVVSRTLLELQQEAALIVHGNVVSATVAPHPRYGNLDTVLVTLRVKEAVKGPAAGTYTFRQFIWDPRDARDAAGYRKGQELLLLMHAPNEHGLSSPVGLGQGRFVITRNAKGEARAVNGHGNAGLFRDLQNAPERQRALSTRARGAIGGAGGAVDLEALKEILRSQAGTQ
jgi:hypothetical protein